MRLCCKCIKKPSNFRNEKVNFFWSLNLYALNSAAVVGNAGRRVEAKAKLEANRGRHLEILSLTMETQRLHLLVTLCVTSDHAKLAEHLEQEGADIIQTQGGKCSNPSNPGLSVATALMAITTGAAGVVTLTLTVLITSATLTLQVVLTCISSKNFNWQH
nr:hypothetical protein [Tanacetum cinerariifolium]